MDVISGSYFVRGLRRIARYQYLAAPTALVLFLFTTEVSAQIRLTETGGGTDYISIQAPASVAATVNWILPDADGAVNQCIATDGAGNMRFRSTTGNGYSLEASDGNPVNAVYVEAAGRVGIGTTSPEAGIVLHINGTSATQSSMVIPRDTTANRPTGVNGMLRYNTTTAKFEGYENGDWVYIAAGLMGKLEWAGTANCFWLGSNGGTFTNIAADADCPNPTVTGGATAPGTKIPAIVINNLPKGDYEVTVSGQFINTAPAQCRWRMSDGTTGSGFIASNILNETTTVLTSIFTYASTGTRTFTVQSRDASGTGGCQLRTSETGSKTEIWVRRL